MPFSQANWQIILEDAHDAIIILDGNYQIIFWNHAAEQIYGWTAPEVYGKLMSTILPTVLYLDGSTLEEVIHTVFRDGFWRGEVIQHHRKGHPLQIESSVRAIYDSNQNLLGLVGVNRDMTERAQREQAQHQKMQEHANILKRQIDRLHILADASHALAVIGPNLERRMQAVLEQIARTIGESCVIYLRSSDDNHLHPRAIYHPDPAQIERLWKIAGPIPAPFNAQLNGETLPAQHPLVLNQLRPEDVLQLIQPSLRDAYQDLAIHALMNVPLIAERRIIGMLSVARYQPDHPYTNDDLQLLQDIADRAALAFDNAYLYQAERSAREQHERSLELLRNLSRRLVEVQEHERRHIARELHDEVGQTLTGLSILLELMARGPAEQAIASAEQAHRYIQDLTERVRDLSLGLRPAMLDDLGLIPALLWLFGRFQQQTGILVRFQHHGLQQRFDSVLETSIYRIVQEGLTNAARHANVTEVVVQISATDQILQLQIEDAGVGFDVHAARQTLSTSGIPGMEERVALLGGQITIESSRGHGTLILVEFPIIGAAA